MLSPISMTEEIKIPIIDRPSKCTEILVLFPEKTWPKDQPGLAVNSVLWAGENQTWILNYNLDFTLPKDRETFCHLFKNIYGDLTFPELAHLFVKTKDHPWFPLKEVLQNYNYTWSENLFDIIQTFNQLSTPLFTKWAIEKKVGPGDLMPLLSAKNLSLDLLFQKLLAFPYSKNTGILALELGIELLLLEQTKKECLNLTSRKDYSETDNKDCRKNEDKDFLKLKDPHLTGDYWIQHLKQLRYPNTVGSDPKKEVWLNELHWPKHSQAKWLRKGDRSGIEVKFFVSHKSEFKKVLTSLNDILIKMEKDGDLFWNEKMAE